MSNDALWAARLHLSSGTPATLLGTEMIRAICEDYVRLEALISAYGATSIAIDRAVTERCREEVLKERDACATIAKDFPGDSPECDEIAAAIRERP